MSFLDKFKGLKGKAQDAVDQHGDKISQGIDKAAKLADEKTQGKYSEKIDTAQQKSKEALEKLDGKQDGDLR
ncbi:hypothetical protein GCM10009623_26120 [Nocardioides aestuarii]|uniref:Antitoxin n=1 Tax=Nocardioides aestuarii TaxID=252231 RepID=A0ABW4TQ45_9ACTN